MKILIIEPYLGGSHKDWAESYQAQSAHQIEVLSLPGAFWKWRMHGGAVTLANRFMASDLKPDLILATDMLDLTTFLSLTRTRTSGVPTAIYFHENQITYPWSPHDRDVDQKRDTHYGFINYVSSLAADRLFFNSQYHLNSYLSGLWRFLRHFPDNRNLHTIDDIAAKSEVLPLGLNLEQFDKLSNGDGTKNRNEVKLILWNHRWEFDKNPTDFFLALFRLAEMGYDFKLALIGECFSKQPKDFLLAKEILKDKIVQYGYAEGFDEYARWLWRTDILPVTSIQDFFGASVAEAIYCKCVPLLPKRLSYPEIVPEHLHDTYLYDNFDDLLGRLESLLTVKSTQGSPELRQSVLKYSWTNMAPEYDLRLAEVGRN